MAKVHINGEIFDWDRSRQPMSEALAIEEGLKCRYTDFEDDLRNGSARAMCGFIWLVWRRDGRDVALADILSGEVEIDRGSLLFEREEEETAPDPTGPLPEASSPTAASTSGSSRRSSASSPGSSGS
jgi:hypothetical protein